MPEIDNDENKNQIDDHEEATVGMDEVDNFDFERAVMLMGVMEKVANVGVKSTAIGGLAAASLNEMNEEAKAIAKRRAEAYKELERKRDAKLAAEQREHEAAEAAKAEEAAKSKSNPVPRMQASAPAPSKTDQVAIDNTRRV